MKASVLMVMAGPNGSGKSTITSQWIAPGNNHVNADDIQRHLNCTALEAAQIAENTREWFLSQQEDFSFESVLSTPRNYNLMEKAKKRGYIVVCIYVLTKDPQINISRVKARVQQGLHDVPAEKVIERYIRAMQLFPRLFEVCDECYVYDNSMDRTEGTPEMILKWTYGVRELFSNSAWTLDMLEALCEGKYFQKTIN